MPFDTTYFFVNEKQGVTKQIIIPGGKDAIIYIKPGDTPVNIIPNILLIDSLLAGSESMTIPVAEKPATYTPDSLFIITFIGFLAFVIFQASRREQRTRTEQALNKNVNSTRNRVLSYYGDELDFSDQELSAILNKRFPYYRQLSKDEQPEFINRLQKFIADKTFKIHAEKGFKEMPVLISATAIQLTFGLKKFLLPHFHFIHIHPQEFLRIKPILCFLEGNVSGHSINLSWKHFLQGYADPADGQNVGLHELAHALYYQTFDVEKNVDRHFRNYYDDFHVDGNKAYHTEKTIAGGLYSEYAEKNFHEFWAESVEIFFEKPVELRSHYPELYETMCYLLKQDPIRKVHRLVV